MTAARKYAAPGMYVVGTLLQRWPHKDHRSATLQIRRHRRAGKICPIGNRKPTRQVSPMTIDMIVKYDIAAVSSANSDAQISTWDDLAMAQWEEPRYPGDCWPVTTALGCGRKIEPRTAFGERS